MIVGIVGFIGSGKDTAAEYLENEHNFKKESFAASLKDAVSNVFGWDRDLVEGQTEKSREWRNQVDEWWATRLNMPQLTPRWVLQHWGTELCRVGFHTDIWLASLERRILNSSANVVISDCRFENEIAAIKRLGGKIIQINRTSHVHEELMNFASRGDQTAIQLLNNLEVHQSEWAWRQVAADYIIDNTGSLYNLYVQLGTIINQELNPPAAT